MASFGLVAAMLAAATNGLAAPIFIHQYRDATPDVVDTLRPVLTFSHAVNTAFDYVYTGTFCLAILGWSVAILRTKQFPRWIAGWGILISIAGVAIAIAGASPASLLGLRLFVAGLVSWVIIVGVTLIQKSDA